MQELNHSPLVENGSSKGISLRAGSCFYRYPSHTECYIYTCYILPHVFEDVRPILNTHKIEIRN